MIQGAGVDKRVIIRCGHFPRDLSFHCSDVSVWNGSSQAPFLRSPESMETRLSASDVWAVSILLFGIVVALVIVVSRKRKESRRR